MAFLSGLLFLFFYGILCCHSLSFLPGGAFILIARQYCPDSIYYISYNIYIYIYIPCQIYISAYVCCVLYPVINSVNQFFMSFYDMNFNFHSSHLAIALAFLQPLLAQVTCCHLAAFCVSEVLRFSSQFTCAAFQFRCANKKQKLKKKRFERMLKQPDINRIQYTISTCDVAN